MIVDIKLKHICVMGVVLTMLAVCVLVINLCVCVFVCEDMHVFACVWGLCMHVHA